MANGKRKLFFFFFFLFSFFFFLFSFFLFTIVLDGWCMRRYLPRPSSLLFGLFQSPTEAQERSMRSEHKIPTHLPIYPSIRHLRLIGYSWDGHGDGFREAVGSSLMVNRLTHVCVCVCVLVRPGELDCGIFSWDFLLGGNTARRKWHLFRWVCGCEGGGFILSASSSWLRVSHSAVMDHSCKWS